MSDCQNFKVSPVVTDLISEDNEGDLYTPRRLCSCRGMGKGEGDKNPGSAYCFTGSVQTEGLPGEAPADEVCGCHGFAVAATARFARGRASPVFCPAHSR